MTSSGIQTAQTIAGYTLSERIGAGGYGEVWKAEAPGGLTKAVKIIYGRLGDQRASCEQRALERIKQVRHPFLLSIERIEVVDGQLVIVTELAEASFKDRFDECRQSGLPGIPRKELLVYLGDAAEALDYISEHHSLQHLDVKPENMLLLSGHAKVADFGLVKSVQDKSMSLMGGLTPVYAAPEVFDGRPSLHSDQYSLAIVYQEMLTGALPFPGRTPAQLAAQHTSAEPRLGSLDPADRQTIARALAKNPEERFENSRAMVESLAEARQRPAGEAQTQVSQSSPTPGDSVTIPVDRDGPVLEPRPGPEAPDPARGPSRAEAMTTHVDCSDTASPSRPAGPVTTEAFVRGALASAASEQHPSEPILEALQPAPEVVDLPPLEMSAEEHRMRPTYVLGVGGTGARVLRQLRGRIKDRYGDVALGAIRMTLLDTDRSELGAATGGDPRTALAPDETLALPLRRPQQYRSDARKHLAWLSRRWLYNIPRSLKTQGLRPLGRLALVDHAAVVMDRLRRDLAAATDPETLAASAEALGIAAGDRTPRVYLVASISGGTGSGMLLDLAAMVRKILGELGWADDHFVGMLAHSTGRRPDEHDLAVANAYACLTELHHYHRSGGYPGDEACGLSATRQGPPTFRHAYLVPLGEKLDERQLDTAVTAVAEYLYLDAATPAGVFFDAHRAAEKDPDEETAGPEHLRTFGLAQIGCSLGEFPARATDAVCRRVVARWLGDASAADRTTEQAARELAGKLELTAHGLVAQALEVVHGELGGGEKASRRGRGRDGAGAECSLQTLLERTLDELLARFADADFDAAPDAVTTALERSLDEKASKQGADVAEWILQWAEDSPAGVAGARRGAQCFTEHLQALEAELRQALTAVAEQTAQFQPSATDSGMGGREKRKSYVGRMFSGRQNARNNQRRLLECRLRLSRVVLNHVVKSLQAVHQRILTAEDRLGDLSRTLNVYLDQFPEHGRTEQRASEGNTGASGTEALEQHVRDALDQQVDRLAEKVDHKMRGEPLAEHGLWGLVDREQELLQDVTAALRTISRGGVLPAIRYLAATQLLLDSDNGSPEAAKALNVALENAEPPLTSCGGTRRLLVVAPDEQLTGDPSNGANSASAAPSAVVDPNADMTFCYEMAQLAVRRVATTLIDGRPDYRMVASRLHTRIDVDWTSLNRR